MLEKKKYILPIFLLSFGLFFCIASAFATIGSNENWFSRSGSILSFISIVVQFILFNLRRDELKNLFDSGTGLREKFKNIEKKSTIHQVVYITSGITGLVITLIWGYGDLLF